MSIISEKITPAQVKDSVLELFHSKTRHGSVSLSFDIPENVPPMLIGDKGKLQQILFNLVGNALKFTDFGHVHVNARPLSLVTDKIVHVIFSVSDTEPVISDEQIEYIFEPFL